MKAKKCNIQVVLDMPEKEIIMKIKETAKKYRKIKKRDRQERIEWLKGLARAQVGPNKKKIQNQYNQLMHRERQREVSRQTKYMEGKLGQKNGIQKIEVKNRRGEWVEKVKEKEVVEGCLREAKARFTQASKTPMLMEPLRSELGQYGLNKSADEILEGSYIPPKVII